MLLKAHFFPNSTSPHLRTDADSSDISWGNASDLERLPPETWAQTLNVSNWLHTSPSSSHFHRCSSPSRHTHTHTHIGHVGGGVIKIMQWGESLSVRPGHMGRLLLTDRCRRAACDAFSFSLHCCTIRNNRVVSFVSEYGYVWTRK